jgi:hypothetical protein
MSDINEILTERGKRYGVFEEHAILCQHLKAIMRNASGWDHLRSDQCEALEMVQHKIARILNGDPHYADSWRDIAGYATLVADRLDGVSR